MKFIIAGGVGEHGRNCFIIEGTNYSIMVDCGLAPGSANPFPDIPKDSIAKIKYLFFTHSHNDHSGAYKFLRQNGFCGIVAATQETFAQLQFDVPEKLILNSTAPPFADYQPEDGLNICWGRSGHCAGSIWLKINLEGKSFFFSGDYNEQSSVYESDCIRQCAADIAVIDCAYADKNEDYSTLLNSFAAAMQKLLNKNKPLLMPVPKFGRNLELPLLIKQHFPSADLYGDEHFLSELQKTYHSWLKPNARQTLAQLNCQSFNNRADLTNGIYFISSPQLKTSAAQAIAQKFILSGGLVIFTGHVYPTTPAAQLLQNAQAQRLFFPVHNTYAAYKNIIAQNKFKLVIPFHGSLTAGQNIFTL